MSPVASLVLIRLSPSLPAGRDSTFTVISGFAAWNASATDLAMAWLPAELSTRNDNSVAPPSPELEPESELDEPHAVRLSAPTASTATARVRVRSLLNFIVPPEGG